MDKKGKAAKSDTGSITEQTITFDLLFILILWDLQTFTQYIFFILFTPHSSINSSQIHLISTVSPNFMPYLFILNNPLGLICVAHLHMNMESSACAWLTNRSNIHKENWLPLPQKLSTACRS